MRYFYLIFNTLVFTSTYSTEQGCLPGVSKPATPTDAYTYNADGYSLQNCPTIIEDTEPKTLPSFLSFVKYEESGRSSSSPYSSKLASPDTTWAGTTSEFSSPVAHNTIAIPSSYQQPSMITSNPLRPSMLHIPEYAQTVDVEMSPSAGGNNPQGNQLSEIVGSISSIKEIDDLIRPNNNAEVSSQKPSSVCGNGPSSGENSFTRDHTAQGQQQSLEIQTTSGQQSHLGNQLTPTDHNALVLSSPEPNENRKHSCLICRKSFASAHYLNVHTRTHTGERPYKCSICNKSFTQSSTLKTHQLTHSGKRPWTCNVCNKTFALRGNLRTHQLIHTGEKPYACDFCDKKFTQSHSLKKHLMIHSSTRNAITYPEEGD